MTDKQTQQQAQHSNMEKDPDTWVTGDEPMTGAQRSYLKTLSEEAHVPFEDGLTKAQASQRIEALQAQTGRGEQGKTASERNDHEPDGVLESVGRAVSEAVLGSGSPELSGGAVPGPSTRRRED